MVLWKARGRLGSAARRIKAWMTRARAMRLGWYASLAALLVLLGSASYAYRNRAVPMRQTDEPRQAVLSAYTPAPTLAPTPTPAPPRYVWPVEGEIIGDFSADALTWSQTLDQWQTHPALDIAASVGEAVVACADGVVEDAWRDPLWGNVIAIDHGDGHRSVYAGLNSLELVTVGQTVKMGEVISSVGDTADCEADQPWHLHFAFETDGDRVDYAKFMKENTQSGGQ